MMKKAVRHWTVEQLSRLGEASLHEVGGPDDVAAQTYHYHNTLEVVVVRRGWVEGLVGEVSGKLCKDMVLVLGGDVPHCIVRASKDSVLLLVHIPSELLQWDEKRFPELACGVEFLRSGQNGIVFRDVALAEKLVRMAGKTAASEGFMRMSLLLRMIHLLNMTPPAYSMNAMRRPFGVKLSGGSAVDRAYRYLYRHFREPLSLSDVAEYAGLTTAALCRAFKRASGCTVIQFVTRLRVEYACRLLSTTDLDVSQIAYEAGYGGYSHFCTQFKKSMNVSPSAYRARCASGTPAPQHSGITAED